MSNITNILSRIKIRKRYESSCERKKVYRTKNLATLALDKLLENNSYRSRDNSLEVYQCNFCNQYHIGHRI